MTDRTHGPFKVGDVVEIVSHKLDGSRSENFGRVGVVIEVGRALVDSLGNDRNDGVHLDISEPNTSYPPERLHLRPPKSDQSQWIREATTTWDQIQRETGWQPMRERV